MAQDCGVKAAWLRERHPRIDEIGFDAGRKMMTTLHRVGNRQTAYTKGAAERILENCAGCFRDGRMAELTVTERERLLGVQKRLMGEGRRVLALAMEPEGA